MGGRDRGRWLPAAMVIAVLCAPPASASASTFKWSPATTIDGAPFTTTVGIAAASCPTASLCVTGDDQGDILTSKAHNGGAPGWHATRPVDPPAAFSGISCPSRSECVAVSQSGDIASSRNPTGGRGAWRVAHTVAGQGGHNYLR